jgi:hypothetical protein
LPMGNKGNTRAAPAFTGLAEFQQLPVDHVPLSPTCSGWRAPRRGARGRRRAASRQSLFPIRRQRSAPLPPQGLIVPNVNDSCNTRKPFGPPSFSATYMLPCTDLK